MIHILYKEINHFFSSLIGYISMIVFLLVSGLFLWIFPGAFNILYGGYATLDGFFDFAPFVLMFLIPAITMRSFSEEISSGTYEFLSTRPVSDLSVVAGKFLAALALVIFALIPTILYIYTISKLADPPGDID